MFSSLVSGLLHPVLQKLWSPYLWVIIVLAIACLSSINFLMLRNKWFLMPYGSFIHKCFINKCDILCQLKNLICNHSTEAYFLHYRRVKIQHQDSHFLRHHWEKKYLCPLRMSFEFCSRYWIDSSCACENLVLWRTAADVFFSEPFCKLFLGINYEIKDAVCSQYKMVS